MNSSYFTEQTQYAFYFSKKGQYKVRYEHAQTFDT